MQIILRLSPKSSGNKMEPSEAYLNPTVLHWNYRGFTDFPLITEDHRRRKIKDIYLKENNISRLPRDIYRLDRLESLYLCGNDISYVPKEIGLLRRLKCLDLSGNGLVSLPDEIGDVTRLQYLILDDNAIRELPLRTADLRALRYLSVCDNKLEWLSQRVVHNYQHCELRFWRNHQLSCLPYSLWYHMFRNQQIRALNIGCLSVAGTDAAIQGRCILKMHSESPGCKIGIPLPALHRCATSGTVSPATLLELCKRELYLILQEKARHNSSKVFDSTYADEYFGDSFDETISSVSSSDEFLQIHDNESGNADSNSEINKINEVNQNDHDFTKLDIEKLDIYVGKNNNIHHRNINQLDTNGNEMNEHVRNKNSKDATEYVNIVNLKDNSDSTKIYDKISTGNNKIEHFSSESLYSETHFDTNEDIHEVVANVCTEDENNNVETNKNLNLVDVGGKAVLCCNKMRKTFDVTTSQLVEKYLCYLPDCLKKDLKNGPVSRCENIPCKRPVFQCAFLQFTIGKLLLIDTEQDVILSAVFCSNSCSQQWAGLQTDLIPWDFADGSS